MFFFRRKKGVTDDAKKERQIQAIRKDTFKRIDRANKSIDKLTHMIDKDMGVTELIFLATGGDNRHERR